MIESMSECVDEWLFRGSFNVRSLCEVLWAAPGPTSTVQCEGVSVPVLSSWRTSAQRQCRQT